MANQHNTSGACAGKTGLCLTTAQLQGIFVNCTITNWNQVGGANAPIKIYTILPQYGTSKFWYLSLAEAAPAAVPRPHPPDRTTAEIAVVDLKERGSCPVSVGSWNGALQGQARRQRRWARSTASCASLTTIRQRDSFPFGRFIYNVLLRR